MDKSVSFAKGRVVVEDSFFLRRFSSLSLVVLDGLRMSTASLA